MIEFIKLLLISSSLIKWLRKYGYDYYDNKSLLNEWRKNGILLSNGKKVLILLMEKKEKRFSIIILEHELINKSFNKEINDYIVLDNYLQKVKTISNTFKYTNYGLFGLRNVINNNKQVLAKYANELL